jgi:hypothetical protein
MDASHEGDKADGLKAYENRDYFRALHELYPLALDKDPEAQRLLGVMFAHGRGVPADSETARVWLERAALQEDVEAQRLLGRYLGEGRYLEKNTRQATYWLGRAAVNGNADAQFYLASLYRRENAVPDGQTKAFRWTKAAAEQGHLAAQGNLGWMYQHGVGVAADQAAAEQWLLEAAGEGLAAAQFNLSLLYDERAKPDKAHAWLRKAAVNGHEDALVRLLSLSEQGIGSGGSLSLFGVTLTSAGRDLMRQRIARAGGIVLHESNDQWVDVYEASELIEGADRLFVSYSLQDQVLAELRYRFPGLNTPEGVARLLSMIGEKYGEPLSGQEPYEFSGLHGRWRTGDVTIEVRRSWPEGSLLLRFFMPEKLRTMRAEQTGAEAGADTQPRLAPY